MQPIAAPLLQWFYANKRLLPFRLEPSAYHIWVSEIMLQQTRMTAAVPYYNRFIAALPDPAALAACPTDALRKLWQGLGYYNRVNNMQKAARIVCKQYGGELPADYAALRALPGIGDYTAGAIASIAFGLPVPAVDGNVLRVFARLYNDDADIMTPAAKRLFTQRVLDQMPKDTPGAYNEALMELGALVCIPGTPHCGDCPLRALCRGCAAGRADKLPVKPAPKEKRTVPVTVALISSEQGLLLQRRPAKGLLAGLWQPAAWESALTREQLQDALQKLGIPAVLGESLPPAKHVFTHRIWQLGGWQGTAPAVPLPDGYVWAAKSQLAEIYPVPNAFAAYVKPDADTPKP
ncbi:MAG: A/G-specific adenine glycosylase [Gemmiger sp.]|nr:A/G-specific adenine glycosylase [Gemmiger sp.]